MFVLGGCCPPDPLLFLGDWKPPRPPGGGPAAPRAPSQIFERLRLSSSLFFGTKVLAPGSWYQEKTESPRGGASRYAGGHGGLQAPRQGVWGAGSPPGTAGGLGGGSPPVKTILWTQNQDFGTRIWYFLFKKYDHFQPPSTNHLPITIFRQQVEPITTPPDKVFERHGL